MQEIKAPDGTLIKVATINSLLKRVGDAWEEKFVPLYLESEQFYPGFKDWDHINIGLSSYALVEAVGNAHEDIKRWCYFHLAGKSQEYAATPDRHKYGGFLAKWIAKEKPIFVEQKSSKTPVDLPDSLYRLNAFFAVTVLQDYLLQPIPPRLAEELAYILHFRDESGEVLALLGYCAEEMATASI
jgi:hypothetical protein